VGLSVGLRVALVGLLVGSIDGASVEFINVMDDGSPDKLGDSLGWDVGIPDTEG